MIFVLTRLNVEIHRLPAMGEEVSLLTWHRDGKGAQLYRCYQLLDGRGTVLTEGVSAFALVEVESHRPLRPTVFEQFGIGSQPDRRNGCPDPGRLGPGFWVSGTGAAPASRVNAPASSTPAIHLLILFPPSPPADRTAPPSLFGRGH